MFAGPMRPLTDEESREYSERMAALQEERIAKYGNIFRYQAWLWRNPTWPT